MGWGDYVPISRYVLNSRIAEAINQKFTAVVFPRLSRIDRRLSSIEEKQRELEERMTTAEETAWAQLGALIGVVIAEVTSLRDGIAQKDAALVAAQEALEQERADRDATVAQQVADAIGADSASDTARTLDYLSQLSAAAPVEVPEVPVPAPGEPATPPEDIPPAEPTE